MELNHIIIIDIDGLRPDVFAAALRDERLPNLAQLLGGANLERGMLSPVLSPAPSITFTSQACLFTGAHPARHGIPGNQFFDRFGKFSKGRPRHYAFDIGDRLEVDDAVRVFTDGLAARCLQAPTIYEQLTGRGWRSVVAGHMYARGADEWLRTSLISLARLTKGKDLFGIPAAEFDRQPVEKVLQAISEQGLPNVLTVYFMGVDHESHQHGPQSQLAYLSEVLDPYIGELRQAVSEFPEAPLWVICSDHGQVAVPAGDFHSLRLGFPFDREIGHLFDALGLDVHDIPGEDPNCDAVVSLNGGIAYVYLQNRRGRWADPPDFERDVLPVGVAFWEAHASGRYAPELEGALAGVLVRNVSQDGWQAPYLALTPGSELQTLDTWFGNQPEELYSDPVHRLKNLAGPLCGDLLLISNYASGYYFAAPISGVHGGLHPEDSPATLAIGYPAAPREDWIQAKQAFTQAIWKRCQAEGGRQPTTADLWPGLKALID